MAGPPLDTTGLDGNAARTLRDVVRWLRLMTSDRTKHGRYEIVVQEGKVKVMHETFSKTPELVM